MNMGRIKIYIIALLIVASTSLTLKLWFGDISIHNFFYPTSKALASYSEPELFESVVKPYRVLTCIGDNEFNVIYNNIDSSEQMRKASETIMQTLKKGAYERAVSITNARQWDYMLESDCIIFEYNFTMPSDSFVGFYKQSANMLTSRVKAFNSVIIKPDVTGAGKTRAIFLDSDNLRYYEYSLENEQLNHELLSVIRSVKNQENDLYYYSSNFGGYGANINKNIFIAVWEPEEPYEYNKIYAENPYGEISSSNIEPYIEFFFNNPNAITPSTINSVYTYRDNSKVVKYYANAVLEYNTSMPKGSGQAATFTSSYMAALNMVKSDFDAMRKQNSQDKVKRLYNDYFLAEYQYSEEKGEWRFYFDYAVNNFPVSFTKTTASDLNMKHAVEVTVAKSTVIQYKRFVNQFYVEKDALAFANNDFINAFESVYSPMPIEGETESTTLGIEKCHLSYIIDNNQSYSLQWSIELQEGMIMNISSVGGAGEEE